VHGASPLSGERALHCKTGQLVAKSERVAVPQQQTAVYAFIHRSFVQSELGFDEPCFGLSGGNGQEVCEQTRGLRTAHETRENGIAYSLWYALLRTGEHLPDEEGISTRRRI